MPFRATGGRPSLFYGVVDGGYLSTAKKQVLINITSPLDELELAHVWVGYPGDL